MRKLASTLVAAFLANAFPAAAQQTPDLEKQPTLFSIGYAHLDTEWRWSYLESIRDYLPATLHDNFRLLDKYPGYVFNFTGSNRYKLMKEYWPEDYARLKKYIADGRWFPAGSSVEEGDVNSPSLEGLIRQVLYGNLYFKREFGVASSEFMLPDCFGFPAALPSVLAHCGVKGFSTQKLTWGSAVGIPFNVGVWEGPDGRSVVAALNPGSYGSSVHEDLSQSASWLKRVRADGGQSGLFADYRYYGTGDMGGGPDEESVADMEKSMNGSGPLKVVGGRADAMFNALTPEEISKLPRYKGDLELTNHSAGSLTSEAMMKAWNHENEKLAQAAEEASAAGTLLGFESYPGEKLRDAWTLDLAGHFHDLLAGTALPKAYDYAWNDQLLAMNQFETALGAGVGAVSRGLDTNTQGEPIVVFNPLSYDRDDPIETTLSGQGQPAVYGPEGERVPAQVDASGRLLFMAHQRGLALSVFNVRWVKRGPPVSTDLHADKSMMENSKLRVTVNAQGDVSSIYDKVARREALSAPIRLAFMHENPTQWPAWNMDWSDQSKPPYAYLGGKVKVSLVEMGPVRAAIQIEREGQGSKFIQQVRLSAGSDRVEFLDKIDWKTAETALKAVFPFAASNERATYNWQVGTVERGNDEPKRFEVASHDWFDLTDRSGGFGASVLSVDKFGSDKPDSRTLRLTLLYTPGTQGGYQDQGTQDWGHHEIRYGLAPHAGDWRGETPRQAAELDQPVFAYASGKHAGTLGRRFQLLSLSASGAKVTALKKAEEDDAMVVRVRENTGRPFSGALNWNPELRPLRAVEVDGQEREVGPATLEGGDLKVDIQPYGLRSYKVWFEAPQDQSTDSVPVELPYNLDAISTNANRKDGNFDGHGRSLPSEQLPDVVEAEGVRFVIGPRADGAKNAVACKGQMLKLPKGGSRFYLLAARSEGSRLDSFNRGNSLDRATFLLWTGYLGTWDHREWKGSVAGVAYDWPNQLDGLTRGYLNTQPAAWSASHVHSAAGDEIYNRCYLFKFGMDLAPGQDSIQLPDDPSLKVLAASVAEGPIDELWAISPPVYDPGTVHQAADQPAIVDKPGTSRDSTVVSLKPGFYGRESELQYRLGNGPFRAYTGPFWVHETLTLTARTGSSGRPVSQRVNVKDVTPPKIVRTAAWDRLPVVHLYFSEPTEGAGKASNYHIDGVKVRSARTQSDGRLVELRLDRAVNGPFALRLTGIRDLSPGRNAVTRSPIRVEPVPMGPTVPNAEVRPGAVFRGMQALPISGSAPWTMAFSVYMDKEPASLTPIVGFGNSSDGSPDGTTRYICEFEAGIHFWGRNVDIDAGRRFMLGRWQRVVTTYDGKNISIYLDGEKLVTAPAHLNDAKPDLHVAPLDGWEGKRQFDGKVKDIQIWTTALDAESVKAIYGS